FGSGMRIALGIASVAHEVLEISRRTEHVRLDLRHYDLEAAGGANESESTSVLHEPVDDGRGSCRDRLQQLDEQMHGNVKRVDFGLHGHMQLQGMQQLGQNEGQPQLDQHQFGAGSPPDVQAQFALEQLEGQFNVPASGIELGDVTHGQVGGVQHGGQVAILRAVEGKTDQTHG